MDAFLKNFTFQMCAGTTLKKTAGSHILLSDKPVRLVKISPGLYNILQRIRCGESLLDLIKSCSPAQIKSVTNVLLSFSAQGFLSLHYDGRPVERQAYPAVTVVIPVKNRPEEMKDCLHSLFALDYPRDKVEIIVVDDGSVDTTRDVVRSFPVQLIGFSESRGPAACRNIGAGKAKGEIIAFLDSDCTVQANWLQDIVPYFALAGIGAVGGFVDSYYNRSGLDKYEAARSPLNMGKRILFETQAKNTFYVPSCNLLVRKDCFIRTGGFQEDLQVGEDVDFCWRMRKHGYPLLYVPAGAVFHKHRNLLLPMLKRRLDYGTSEASLYFRHAEKEKEFPVPVCEGLSFLALLISVILLQPVYLAMNGLLFYDLYRKTRKISKLQKKNSRCLFLSTARSRPGLLSTLP